MWYISPQPYPNQRITDAHLSLGEFELISAQLFAESQDSIYTKFSVWPGSINQPRATEYKYTFFIFKHLVLFHIMCPILT